MLDHVLASLFVGFLGAWLCGRFILRRQRRVRAAKRLAAWSAPLPVARTGDLLADYDAALVAYVRHMLTAPPAGAESAHADAARALHLDASLLRNDLAAALPQTSVTKD